METENIEDRLFSLVYHGDNHVEDNIPSTCTPQTMRSVTSRSVSNITELNKQTKRYWTNKKAPENQVKANMPSVDVKQSPDSPPPPPVQSKFVPYSSVLSSMNIGSKNMEKTCMSTKAFLASKSKGNSKSKGPKTKFLNPLSKSGFEKMLEIKKPKTSNKNKKTNQELKIKVEPSSIEVSSESDDDVITLDIEQPATISLVESSDESSNSKREFSQPNEIIRSKNPTGNFNLNRCGSPSSASMMSDDFIINHDKSRYQESFTCEMVAPETMQTEDTKTLKELNLEKPSSSVESSSGQTTDRSSCEKEKVKRIEPTIADNTKDCEDDSLYRMKCKKRIDLSRRKRSSSFKQSDEPSSSSEDEAITVTKKQKVPRRKSVGSSTKSKSKSESEVEIEPRHKLFKSSAIDDTRSASNPSRNFLSKSYVDDDFDNMLSTILQNDDSNKQDEIDKEIFEKDSVISLDASLEAIDSVGENSEKLIPKNPEILDVDENSYDCVIVEKPIETINLDTDLPTFPDDSNDSDFRRPSNTNTTDSVLILNVKTPAPETHKFVKNFDRNWEVENNLEAENEVLDPEVGWNDEMRRFYNESWGGESFQVKNEINQMPHNSNLWRVRRSDYIQLPVDTRVKCFNCNEFGHMRSKCKRPRKKIFCFMCGEIGDHQATRCSRTLCLRCGKPSKMFSQGCTNCAKFVKKVCPLCHTRGHDISMCPDKWRRYHSTTSENGPLNDQVEYNTSRVYCCVCARKGHWAEQCTSVNKSVSGIMIPGSFVVNAHNPVYTKQNFDAEEITNDHVLNLITYLEDYKFNFEDKIPEQGFYSRIPALKPKPTRQTPKNNENQLDLDNSLKITVDTSSNNRLVEIQSPQNVQNVEQECDDDEEIPISEFRENEPEENAATKKKPLEIKDLFSQSVMPDFISIGNEETQKATKPEEIVTERKILLNRNHSRIIESKVGSKFVRKIGEQYETTVEFGCDDNLGDFILVTGFPERLNSFRNELTNFIYKIEYNEYEQHCLLSSQIPKDRQKIVQYLQQMLAGLKKHYQAPEKIHKDMLEAEKCHDFKKVIKCQKILNIVLLGQAGCGEGKKHLSALKLIMVALQNDHCNEKQIPKELRNDVSEHMRYIFSSEKRDYPRLLVEYSSNKIAKSVKSPVKVDVPTVSNQGRPQPFMELIDRCRFALTQIRDGNHRSVTEMLNIYEKKLNDGSFSKKNVKKLKTLLEMLEGKMNKL